MNTVNESRIAELWVELAGLDLTTEKGQQKNKAIRKELIELYPPLVQKRAEYMARKKWPGHDPAPSEDELISIGYMALIEILRKMRRDADTPTAYLTKALDRAMWKGAFAEHVTAGLPYREVAGKIERMNFRQLEVGEHVKGGGMDWNLGFDGLCSPVASESPWNEFHDGGHQEPLPVNDRVAFSETTELLLSLCETANERRFVEVVAELAAGPDEEFWAGHQYDTLAKRLGISRSNVQRIAATLRDRYHEFEENS